MIMVKGRLHFCPARCGIVTSDCETSGRAVPRAAPDIGSLSLVFDEFASAQQLRLMRDRAGAATRKSVDYHAMPPRARAMTAGAPFLRRYVPPCEEEIHGTSGTPAS